VCACAFRNLVDSMCCLWLPLLALAAARVPEVHGAPVVTAPRAPRLKRPVSARYGVEGYVRQIPGEVRSLWRRGKKGAGDLLANRKKASELRTGALKRGGLPALSYPDLKVLDKSGEDSGTALRNGLTFLFAPRFFFLNLLCNPNAKALPSSFETPEGRERRYSALARARTPATFELLTKLEDNAAAGPPSLLPKKGAKAAAEAESARATRVLTARSKARALKELRSVTATPGPSAKAYEPLAKIQQRVEKLRAKNAKNAKNAKKASLKMVPTGAGKASLLGVSPPVLKAACRLIGSSGPQPGVMRRTALGTHLERLVREDAALAKHGLGKLGRDELLEACLDRGLGSTAASDKRLRQLLGEWVSLMRRFGGGAEPHRLRLAAMAVCATSSVREDTNALPQLVYAKPAPVLAQSTRLAPVWENVLKAAVGAAIFAGAQTTMPTHSSAGSELSESVSEPEDASVPSA